jgi:uncharacterized protein YaaW (UPF0174 family)
MATTRTTRKAATLGSLLPASQAKLLTPVVRKMTKAQFERTVNAHPQHKLTAKDISGLRKLAITRINGGQSAYTWSSHNFKHHDESRQDPATCSTF